MHTDGCDKAQLIINITLYLSLRHTGNTDIAPVILYLVLATLSPEENASPTHQVGDWVSPRAKLNND